MTRMIEWDPDKSYQTADRYPRFWVVNEKPYQYVVGVVPTLYGFVEVDHEQWDDGRNWHPTKFTFIWNGRKHVRSGRPGRALTHRQLTLHARKFATSVVDRYTGGGR